MTIVPALHIKTTQLYAPAAMGACDVLIAGGRILAVGPDLSSEASALKAQTIVADGPLVPGFVDQHMHFLGGGDGDGPFARVPELNFADITAAGITTAVGLLGTESEGKNLNLLLRKAHELDRQGLSTFIYTGAMALPAPTLTGSVQSDLALIEKVIGVKSALAERLFPNRDPAAFAALAGAALLGRSISGKAAVLHLHVGRLQEGLAELEKLVEQGGIPRSLFVPTHINRSLDATPLFTQGLAHACKGGFIDLTCCLSPLDGLSEGLDVVEAVCRAQRAGVTLDQITLSSDSGVAVPDGRGGTHPVPPSIMHRDLVRLVQQGGLALDEALPLVSLHPAQRLALPRKGRIEPGADADLVLLTPSLDIDTVIARGQIVHNAEQAKS